jgi:hypothetical protein
MEPRFAAPDLTAKCQTLTDHEASWWLRAQLDALPARWQSTGVRICAHLRPGRGTGITALYRPDLLTCPDRCADLFKLEGSADFQCDRCHVVSDGIAGVVYDTELDGMQILVMFGLCRACEVKEVGR